jgi:1-acyl-sn-glycerol-3-phosphate acyltransferase
MRLIRSLLFQALLVIVVIPWSFVVLSGYLIPLRGRYWLCRCYTWFGIIAARVICGVRWQVLGWENMPRGGAILQCKHQSTWETFWLASATPGMFSFVYKRELNRLPFFGWGIASLGMINIDRSKGQDAFEQVVTQGAERLKQGWFILMFPEGTRTLPGAEPRYKSGGARLAVRTGAPVVPIAVNTGEVWPRKSFVLSPGLVTVSIGPPIASQGKTGEQLIAEVEAWIETEMRTLAPHRYAGPYVAGERADAAVAGEQVSSQVTP